MKTPINIFWFRRDLRLEDNVALYHSLKSGRPVLPIFIFDSTILDRLPKHDARVNFIFETLQALNAELRSNFSSGIAIYYGQPRKIMEELINTYDVEIVFTNHDYEPYARSRDEEINAFLTAESIGFRRFKDQVIFEKEEIVKEDGKPYVVYTPYMKKWKAVFNLNQPEFYNSKNDLDQLFKISDIPKVSLNDMGFTSTEQKIMPYNISSDLIQNYEATRNFPAMESTSRLGPHLRFGTVSIREIVNKAIAESNEVFWQELIWREFFMQILWHFPQTKDKSFKPKYDRIEWRNDPKDFKAWCDGRTGYPLVDAGMRQLNLTGFMHNRVRMLVGSFLCKHLLIDWRLGEAYFAEKLHDYEMASNIGNWQWVAGCGVDAAPYFRIFNPTTQIQKFDKDLKYIKRWIPEYDLSSYPEPIVDHKMARERCLTVYKSALN